MEYVRLGSTGLMVSRTAFGALPIQRVSDFDAAGGILRAAYDGGVNFFDTARMYSDSEEKLGLAFSEFRITSYNVCYTKLLRGQGRRPKPGGWPPLKAPADRGFTPRD